MGRINRFEDLEAWKLAREINKDIYKITRNGDFGRDFGLRDQIRRTSVSVMSNIAEGFERDGDKEFANFLSLAKGSLGEIRSQLYSALDQEYITEKDFAAIYDKAVNNGRMIAGLINYLKTSNVRGIKFR